MKGLICQVENPNPRNESCKEKADDVTMRISEESILYYNAKKCQQPVLTF